MSRYKNIRVLGITGGVGAGKSTVLSYLEQRYGARLIQCDDAARLLQEPGGSCYQPMRQLLGEQVLMEDGRFDRKRVAEQVFAREQLLEKLNRIVHPAVKAYVKAEIEREERKGQHRLVVVEAALLLEEHYETLCDEIWYIYASEEVRRIRLQKSRGYSRERTENVMSCQKPDAFFREHCHFTVDNSSDNIENTYEQIDEGLKEHGFL